MIIIPDVHGRLFWKEPVAKALGKEHIVFLGDYLDPYEYEGITPEMAFHVLEEIVELKLALPADITLLLGNHDLHYVGCTSGGRRDMENYERDRAFFEEHAKLFQIALEKEAGGQKYLFTHAGIRAGWLRYNKRYLGEVKASDICRLLNDMWGEEEKHDVLFTVLSQVPYSRWGRYDYGSPVWADVEDFIDDEEELEGYYQVFGHTQLKSAPIIMQHFACMDCRRAFRLTDAGVIEPVQ